MLDIAPDSVGTDAARLVVEKLYVPENERVCEYVSGDDAETTAQQLVARLKELRVVS